MFRSTNCILWLVVFGIGEQMLLEGRFQSGQGFFRVQLEILEGQAPRHSGGQAATWRGDEAAKQGGAPAEGDGAVQLGTVGVEVGTHKGRSDICYCEAGQWSAGTVPWGFDGHCTTGAEDAVALPIGGRDIVPKVS